MIKVTVMYPNSAGSKFDMVYYLNTHIPLFRQRLGAAVKGVAVEQGLGGVQPGSPPAYMAMGHALFESVEAFQQAFAPHAEELGDIPNCTNIQPTIQISEVKM
jgi:uncharacterized protein (TIGR02118 family)